MLARRFFIEDDKMKLHCKMDFPEEIQKTYDLVILVHGFTGHMEEVHILGLRDTFLSCGFAVLRAEMYGHGMSDGEFENHTLYKWISNIMTVTDYAKNMDVVKDLYLCGHSQGGLLTVIAAGMRPDDYKAIIPMSPALMIPDDARKGSLLGNPFDPIHIPEYLISENWNWRLSGNYIRAAQSLYPEKYIERYNGPVLMIHGDADDTVPVEVSMKAAKEYANCRLVIIPGDTHCYDYHLDQVLAAVKEYCEEM